MRISRPPNDERQVNDPLLQRAFEPDDGPAADETSERILEAALSQFEAFGLRRSTIEDVARRLGIGRVTIYRRFPRKELLIEAVILRELRKFLAELERAVAPYATTDDRLVEGFAFTLGFLREHTLLNRLLSTEPESLLPFLTIEGGPLLGAARRFLAERLGQEVEQGRLPPLDVEVAGEVLARLVLSYVLTPDSAARLETPEDARRFARRYLAPPLHLGERALRIG